MNKKEKIELLYKIKDFYEINEGILTSIRNLFGSSEHVVEHSIWSQFEYMTDLAAHVLGDEKNEWISWWIWDTQFGQSPTINTFEIDGKNYSVKTPEKFLKGLKRIFKRDEELKNDSKAN